jgi:UMF1 family MFS transporter
MVSFLGTEFRSSEYAYNFLAFSVLFQAFTFVSLGAVGDFGTARKKALVVLSAVGSLTCILCVAVTPETYWLGGVFMIISNCCYGAGHLLYSAWLPRLVRSHEDILAMADGDEKERAIDSKMGEYSNKGYAYGYVGTLLLLILLFPALWFQPFPDEGNFRFAIAVAGVWWMVFSLYTFKHLQARPGPPLPDEATGGCCTCWDYFSHSWRSTYENGYCMYKMTPITFKFVLCWFLFSDGVNVIFTVGSLVAYNNVDWCTLNAAGGVMVLLVSVQLFAAIGNVCIDWVVRKYNIAHKKALFACLLSFLVTPIYGVINWEADGFKFGWEILMLSPIIGFPLGAFQAYARALMLELTPQGYESQYFSFYEITDKGSSWMGPLMMAQIVRHTDGQIRYGFVYIFAMILIPAILMFTVDMENGKKLAIKLAKERPRSGSAMTKITSTTGFQDKKLVRTTV